MPPNELKHPHPPNPSLFAKTAIAAAVVGLVVPVVVMAGSPPEPQRPWTQGTTEAANEVVGSRSGISFALTAPPDPAMPSPLNITVVPAVQREQVLDINAVPPIDPDRPALRIRLGSPPEPSMPAPVELHVLDPSTIAIFGPDGRPAGICSSYLGPR